MWDVVGGRCGSSIETWLGCVYFISFVAPVCCYLVREFCGKRILLCEYSRSLFCGIKQGEEIAIGRIPFCSLWWSVYGFARIEERLCCRVLFDCVVVVNGCFIGFKNAGEAWLVAVRR